MLNDYAEVIYYLTFIGYYCNFKFQLFDLHDHFIFSRHVIFTQYVNI